MQIKMLFVHIRAHCGACYRMSARARHARKPIADDEEEPPAAPPDAALKPAAAPKPRAPAVLLSFGGEEEEEGGSGGPRLAPKRRALAGGFRANLGLAAAAERASTQLPAAGEYSASRLREVRLRRLGRRPAPSSRLTPAQLAAAQRAAPAALLSESNVAPGEAFALDEPEEVRSSAARQPRQLTRPQEAPAGGALAPARDGAQAAALPGAAEVAAARAARERARSGSTSGLGDYAAAPRAGGALGGALAAEARARRGEASEEEEEEALARALAAPPPPAQPPAGDEEAEEGSEAFAVEQLRRARLGSGAAAAPRRAAPPAVSAASAAALASLAGAAARAAASAAAASAAAARAESALAASSEACGALEEAAVRHAARYADVQRFRDFVRDAAACLAAKAPLLEQLELHNAQLDVGASQAYAARAEADLADTAPSAAAAVAAADAALRAGAGEAAAAAAAAAAEAAAAGGGGGGAPVLDEFGRDLGEGRRVMARARGAARAARAAARAAAAASSASSASSDGERAAAAAGAAASAAEASRLFEDAAEEYSELGGISAALCAFKAAQPSAYRDAYVGHSAPQLLAPYVRLQLLGWSPLATAGGDLMGLPWFGVLMQHGAPFAAQDDPDLTLVPQLVRRLALPKLAAAARDAWLPGRRRQAARLADALRDAHALLEGVLPDAQPELLALHGCIIGRLAAAVEACLLPAWPAAALACAGPGPAAFAQRRAAAATRLLACCAAFEGVLPSAPLARLALEGLIGKRIAPHVAALAAPGASGCWPPAARRLRRAAALLPDAWLAGGGRGLEALREAARGLGRLLAAAAALGGAAPGASAAAAADAVEALRRLGCEAEARGLAAVYGGAAA